MKKRGILGLMLAALLIAPLLGAGRVSARRTEATALTPGNDFLVSRPAEGRAYVALAYNDDADEYLAVWSDNRGGTSDWDIYGQFFSSDGVPQGDNFAIQDETDHALWLPDVAYDSDNQRYLVVWEDVTEWDVEGILLNADGSVYKPAFDIASGTASDIRVLPAVAAYAHDSQGTFAVAYEGGQVGDLNIYARLVSITGTVYSEKTVSNASGDQTVPDIAVNPANGYFLIAWQDGRDTVDGIYGCLLYASGLLGTEFAVSATSIPRANPAVAFSPDAGDAGEWLVVFERDVSGDRQIGGKRVAADGTPTGSGIHICDDDGSQRDPAVAHHPSGSYLVVWRDGRGADEDIYGRRVADDGSLPADPFAVSAAAGDQLYPAVAASTSATDPGYLAAFVDGGTDVFGQRLGTDGALTGHRAALSAPLGDQGRVAVAYNSQDEEYLAVWQDERAGNWDIYGQRLDLDGALLGDTFAITSHTGAQIRPAVAYNPAANQYLVVWEDRRTDADIYGQLVNADGTLDGAEIPIAGSGTTARRSPRIAFNSAPSPNEFLVVYTYEEENDNVRGRRVQANGATIGGEIDIATGSAAQSSADVAARLPTSGSGGSYLVVWRETASSQRDIKGQRVNQTGGLLGDVLDICVQSDAQWSPRVAYNPADDHYLVVWPDDRGSDRDIYGRRVGGAGVLKDEIAVSTAAGKQARVTVSYAAGLERWIVAWEDSRTAGSAPDLYAQQVNGDGTLADADAATNELIFEYGGIQQFPAVIWGGEGTKGLLVWEDGRNGQSYHIYGLVLTGSPGSTGYSIFLPLILK